MTLTHPSETEPQSRRVLLAGALGGLAAWAATVIGRAAPVQAAPGDPLRLGRINRAGETSTELRAGTSGDAFHVVQNRKSVGLRAESAGTAINAVTTNPDRYGLFAANSSQDTGTGAAIKAVAFSGGVGIRIEHTSANSVGLSTFTESGTGVTAGSEFGTAVLASSFGGTAIWARTTEGVAGRFDGKVDVNGTMQLTAIAAEDEPAATGGATQLFSRQNAGGKTELCVKFGTGAIQVIATQT